MSDTEISPPHASNKTTVIVSNLHRNDFLASSASRSGLSFVDKIKLTILNINEADGKHFYGPDYYLRNIEHWSSIPFLNRIIIILKSEEVAERLSSYLESGSDLIASRSEIKITLQENLLRRSKSFDSSSGYDNSLNVTSKSLSEFKDYHNGKLGEYKEPEPQEFDVEKTLAMFGIPLSESKDLEQPASASDDSGVKRSRSVTRTLYKPDLKVNTSNTTKDSTNAKDAKGFPSSPTITLDESY